MPRNATTVTPDVATKAVANRLHSAAIHLLRHVRRTDERTGLSPARLSVLSVLVFGGPTTISDLAEAEQVSPPTMSRLVSALEGQGLVERKPDVHDGRVVHVAATPEGARLLLQARRARVELLATRIGDLDPSDIELLGKASEILERIFG